jgi:hypothetical protein
MKPDTNRTYLLIFSAILLTYQYLGLINDGNIPFTQIRISSPENVPVVLTLLIFFFGVQFTYYWLKLRSDQRSLFDFITAIPLAIVAVTPVFYSYLLKLGIDWKVLAAILTLLLAGLLLASTITVLIYALFSIRPKEAMKKNGLGKVPAASKVVFFFIIFLLTPINVAITIFLIEYQYLFPSSLKNYWHIIYIAPTLLLNIHNIVYIFQLCFGSPTTKKNSFKNLRFFQDNLDLLDMHYQYINIEEYIPFELPTLCALARDGQFHEMQKNLSSGVDPDTQDSRGWSALIWATAEGHKEIVELLLEYGANPNIINYLGRSAIIYASCYGLYEISKLLLENGATPNISGEVTKISPLIAAASTGNIKIVKLLIEHGANVNYSDTNNRTALDFSMEKNHGEVAKYLRKIMLGLDNTPPEVKTNLLKNIQWISKE